MHPLEKAVCALGHVATTDDLRQRRVTAAQIRAAIQSGSITRASRGRYVCRHTDRNQLDAAIAHASITCLSALRRAGVWTGLDQSLHLQLPPHAKGSRPVLDHAGHPIHYHWARARFHEGESSWLVAPMEAVWQAIRCLDEENAIACLESAVREGFLTVEQLRRVHAPRRLQRGIRELEFTADSGQETIVRRRLRHAGYAVAAQVKVHGLLYSQDLVVEDCVTLETDGKKWHGPERFHADRDRDIHVEAFGRHTLRLTNRQIMHEWETTFAAIERAVIDAKRERMRRSGRIIVRRDAPL